MTHVYLVSHEEEDGRQRVLEVHDSIDRAKHGRSGWKEVQGVEGRPTWAIEFQTGCRLLLEEWECESP